MLGSAVRLRRPDFTPVVTGRHRRLHTFRKWWMVEVALLIVVALFAFWAFRERLPF